MRAIGLLMGMAIALPAFAQSPMPSDEDILAILKNRVDVERQSIGIAVGVVEPEGARVISYGTLSADDGTPVDGNTLFEIGSVAKIFTTLLLADAVERGEVMLDQPVGELLPEGVSMPGRNERQITLLDLATYRSGLPRLPSNLASTDPEQPYRDYAADDLHEFLSGYELERDIDEAYEYSNLGIGLLGHVLALNAGTDYESLLRERVLEPLEMNDTFLAVPDEMADRFATGHDADFNPVPAWEWGVLEGAGAIRSTANDLNKLLLALVGQTETPLAPAITLATERRAEVGDGTTGIGLGWHITPLGDDEMIWHNGGTGGSRAFVAFMRDAGVGVAVVSNVATPYGVDDLGAHIINQDIPLIAPPSEAEIDPAIFDGLVGDYRLTPEVSVTVFADNDELFAQLTDQPAARIYPASATEYFYRVVDARIVFDLEEDGAASGLTLYQFGVEMPAMKVDE